VIELILYTRNDCELCHEMEVVIAAELPKFDARIQRIEIDGDPNSKRGSESKCRFCL